MKCGDRDDDDYDGVKHVCFGHSGWAIFFQNRSWRYGGLCDELHDEVECEMARLLCLGQSTHGMIESMSLGPSDEYFVQWSDGSWTYSHPSSVFHKAVATNTVKILPVIVAFFPENGWFVKASGKVSWEHLPMDLVEIIRTSAAKIESVVSGNGDGWMVSFSDKSFTWARMPTDLDALLSERKDEGQVLHLALSARGSYFVEFDDTIKWRCEGRKLSELNDLLEADPDFLDPMEIAFTKDIISKSQITLDREMVLMRPLEIVWKGDTWWSTDDYHLYFCQQSKLKEIPVVAKKKPLLIECDAWSASMCGEVHRCKYCSRKFRTICGRPPCCPREASQTNGAAECASHSEACDDNPLNIKLVELKSVSSIHEGLSPLLIKYLQCHRCICGVSTDNILDKLVSALHSDNSRIYSLQDANYGTRGGRPYFKPCGWVRFAVGEAGEAQSYRCREWCVAYHGTDLLSAMKIMVEGLKQPGESGVQIRHGQAYSKSQTSIYVSPALGYSAFPVYAPLAEVGHEHWLQCVLQVRVRPGSFVEKPGSLSSKHWPANVRFDKNFDSMNGLEWLIEDPANHQVTGLLVRELGPKAAGDVYGSFAPLVTQGRMGPEYEVSRLLEWEHRRKGWLM
mmetsp:Transcript_19407/g.41360  ORF Transcript_19407/g.41360 Transcript_19407/m.41360 type:complete len:623 (-) Transcript_19407:72-1940(-)